MNSKTMPDEIWVTIVKHGQTVRDFDNGGIKYTRTDTLEGKRLRLGSFDNKEDAINARKEAEKKYGYHENHGRKK